MEFREPTAGNLEEQRARDAALVAALIITGRFCRRCIEEKTTVTGLRLRVLTEWAHPYVGIVVSRAACEGCRAIRRTYRLG